MLVRTRIVIMVTMTTATLNFISVTSSLRLRLTAYRLGVEDIVTYRAVDVQRFLVLILCSHFVCTIYRTESAMSTF